MLPARSIARALLALVAATALLAACIPAGDDAEQVEPTAQPVYPQLATDPDIPVVMDIPYSTRDGQTQYLDGCFPEDEVVGSSQAPRAAIIVIHGGSWRRGDKANINWRAICQRFAREGYVAVSVNYRLAPQWVFPAQLDDVQDAVRWLRDPDIVARYNIDPERIGAFGGSAGGNLAALLGTSGSGDWTSVARIAAVVDLSGPSDLVTPIVASTGADPDFVQVQLEYLGCASFDDCDTAVRASPITYADETDPPFLIAHSTQEFIPLSQSERLVSALRDAGVEVEFLSVEGTLHSIAMLDDPMMQRILIFFGEALKEDPLDQAQPAP